MLRYEKGLAGKGIKKNGAKRAPAESEQNTAPICSPGNLSAYVSDKRQDGELLHRPDFIASQSLPFSA